MLKTETCIFTPGQYFEGNVRDRGLEKTKFIDIARLLAVHLKKNSYLPAKTFRQADLVLVVHWGVTVGTDRDREMEIRDPDGLQDARTMSGLAPSNTQVLEQLLSDKQEPLSGPSALSYEQEYDFRTLEVSTNQVDTRKTQNTMSAMLGFNRDLTQDEHKPFTTGKATTLAELLESDRYFIIVIAYDWQRWLTEKKMVRLWTSRLSIRSPGVNFQTAIERMGQVGSATFGTSNPEVTIARAKKRTENVIPGELLFLGYEDKKNSDEHKNNGYKSQSTEKNSPSKKSN